MQTINDKWKYKLQQHLNWSIDLSTMVSLQMIAWRISISKLRCMTYFYNFWTPFISLERIKLETSNLVCGLISKVSADCKLTIVDKAIGILPSRCFSSARSRVARMRAPAWCGCMVQYTGVEPATYRLRVRRPTITHRATTPCVLLLA